MNLKLKKSEVKKLHSETSDWGKNLLVEKLGEDLFKKKNFDEIKNFEDACEELGIDPATVTNENDTPDEAAYKKLKIVVRAINQGWAPDWNDSNQYKYWPYFVLSSGSGFSHSNSFYDYEDSDVGSRLCFDTREKSNYAGKQFSDLYEEFLTIKQ